MFDLDFDRFISATLIKVLYALVLVVTGIVGVAGILAPVVRPDLFDLMDGFVTSLGAVLFLIIVRVVTEGLIVIYRIAEHLQKLVQLGEASATQQRFSAAPHLGPIPGAPANFRSQGVVCHSCGMTVQASAGQQCPQCGAMLM